MEVGLRVVRGKDWKWGDQDGGEGSVGTVVEIGGEGGKIPKNTVVVVWDNGPKANYRAGHQGADDLRVLDNAAAEFQFPRGASRKVQAKGIYLGATVVRGTNWNYKNQDGGPDKQGVVQSIGGSSEGSSWRSWVKVKWDSVGANDYHRGHDGKMDVKCVKVAAGETYYVDHLACLADYADSVFCSGDRVKLKESQMLDSDKDELSEGVTREPCVYSSAGKKKAPKKTAAKKTAAKKPVTIVRHVDVGFSPLSNPRRLLEEDAAKILKPESLVKSASEGNLDEVRSIIKKYPSQDKVSGCNIPLHLAVENIHFSRIEFLIRDGADIKAQDKDGDTALHLAAKPLRHATYFDTSQTLRQAKTPKGLDEAPAIAKIYWDLSFVCKIHGTWIAICGFLLQNGAQLDIQNDSGKSPIDLIGDEKIKKIIKGYAR